ncbi:MAG: T9SS type A sorting domain-containing protein [Arcticibacter sp.]
MIDFRYTCKRLLLKSTSALAVLVSIWSLQPAHVHAACENSFAVDWSNPATYSVSCGNVTPSGWKVTNEKCTYSSPLFSVGTSADGSNRQVDLTLRVNQSGNLDSDDTARVLIYVNGSIYSTTNFVGNNSNSVFSINPLISVPSGGTYQVYICLVTNASNEFWTVKSGDFTTCIIAPTPLPVSLVDFDVQHGLNGQADVTWVTQSEKVNDYFTIDRSINGDVFEPLAKVDGAGNSNEIRHYLFKDTNPLQGLSYYRLSQTDFDGTVTVCGLVTYHAQDSDPAQPSIVLRNNPFKDQLSLTINSSNAGKTSIRLLSNSGEESFEQEIPVQTGKNTLDIPLTANLQPGIYTLVVTTDNGDQLVSKAVKR